jgi:hypothetical protein
MEAKSKQEPLHPSDKVGFKSKWIRRDKEGQYILIKGKIHQEETMFIYIYIYIIYIYIYSQKCWCTQFHKINTIGHNNNNGSRNNNSGWLWYPSLISR